MINELFSKLLTQIENYFVTKHYHFLLNNLEIGVLVLKTGRISPENQQKLTNLLHQILPQIDRQSQERVVHQLLRDFLSKANSILHSIKLDIMLDDELSEDTQSENSYSQKTWVTTGTSDVILGIPLSILQTELDGPRAAAHPELLNLISSYHLLKILFVHYALPIFPRIPTKEQRESYASTLLVWLGCYLDQLLQAQQNEYSSSRYWSIVHHYYYLLRINLLHENSTLSLEKTERSTTSEKIFSLELARNILCSHFRKKTSTQDTDKNAEGEIEKILQEVLKINQTPTVISPIIFDCVKFRNELASARKNFTSNPTIESQKLFSDFSQNLLARLFAVCDNILCPMPFKTALLLFGSSSRQDRAPYSDIEIALIHQQLEQTYIPADVHCSMLYKLLNLVVASLGETPYKQVKQKGNVTTESAEDLNTKLLDGFRLDDTTGGTKIGTVQHIAGDLAITKLTTKDIYDTDDKESYINALQTECVYMLLNPVLVNTDTGDELFKDYQICIETFLNSQAPNEEWQKFSKKFQLPFIVPPPNLTYRQLIAYYCFFNVVQQSEKPIDDNDLDVVDLKTNLYKPIVYLALNLRLFYNLKSVHPADILQETIQRIDELKPQDHYKLFPWDLLPIYLAEIPKLLEIRAAEHNKHQRQQDQVSKKTLPSLIINKLENTNSLLNILYFNSEPTNIESSSLILLPLKKHLQILVLLDFTAKLRQINNFFLPFQKEDPSKLILLQQKDYMDIYDFTSDLKKNFRHLQEFIALDTQALKNYKDLLRSLKTWLETLQFVRGAHGLASDRVIHEAALRKSTELQQAIEALIISCQMQCGNTLHYALCKNSRDQFETIFAAVLKRYIHHLLFSKQFTAIPEIYLLLSPKLRKECWKMILDCENKVDIRAVDDLLQSCPNADGSRPGMDENRRGFELGLIRTLLSDESPSTVVIQGVGFIQGVFQGSLCASAAAQLKNVAQELAAPKPENMDHNHLVKQIITEGKAYYFKFFPEIPGFELAVSRLYELMIGGGIMQSVLAKMTIDGQDYPVLISEEVPGIRLDEYLKKIPNPRLPRRAFTQLFLMHLFTLPEDAKTNNFKWVKVFADALGISTENLDIDTIGIPIGVDNDRVFGKAVYEQNYVLFKKNILMVKSVMFCFDQIIDRLNPEARQEFLELDPKAIFTRLIDDLLRYQQKLNLVFTNPNQIQKWAKADTAKDKYPQHSLVYMQLSKGVVDILYQQITMMQKMLRHNPNQTHYELMEIMLPAEVFNKYKNLLETYTTVYERFGEILAEYYNGTQSTMPSIEMLAQSHSKPLTLANTHSETSQSLKESADYIRTITTQHKQLSVVKMEIEQDGNTESLQMLPEILQFKVINLLHWKNIAPAVQQQVLQILKKQKNASYCTKLSFSYCSALTSDILNDLLKSRPNLQVLRLHHCDELLEIMLDKLPITSLQKLCVISIHHCSTLTKIMMPNLLQLRILRVVGCPQLELIQAAANMTFEPKIKDCPNVMSNPTKNLLPRKLAEIVILQHIRNNSIEVVDLYNCKTMDIVFVKALSNSLANNNSVTTLKYCRSDLSSECRKIFETTIIPGVERNKDLELKKLAEDFSYLVQKSKNFIKLSEHHLSLDNIQSLCEALLHNKTITVLILRKCGLDDSCAMELLKMLKINTSILEIDIRDNNITESLQHELYHIRGTRQINFLAKKFSISVNSPYYFGVFSHFFLTDDEIKLFYNECMPTLIAYKTINFLTLDFTNNLIGNQGGQILLEMIRTSSKEIFIFVHNNPMSQSLLNLINGTSERNKLIHTKSKHHWSWTFGKKLKGPFTKKESCFREYALRDEEVLILTKSLKKNTNVQILDLRDNLITDVGANYILDMLQQTNTSVSISRIYLNGNNISEQILRKICNEEGYRVAWPESPQYDAIQKATLRITLHENETPESEPLEKNPVENKEIPQEIQNQIYCTSLHNTRLEELVWLTDNLWRVREIYLANGYLTDDEVSLLFDELQANTTVICLNLKNNLLTDVSAQRFLHILVDNNSLMEVYLGGNKINQILLDKIHFILNHRRGIATLNTLLQNLLHTSCINLANFSLTDNDIKPLIDKLTEDTSVIILNLSNNQLTDTSASHIIQLLQSNSKIIEINLWNNKISYTMEKEIELALKRNRELQNLKDTHSGKKFSNVDISALLRSFIFKAPSPICFFCNCPILSQDLATNILDFLNPTQMTKDEQKQYLQLPRVSQSWYVLFRHPDLEARRAEVLMMLASSEVHEAKVEKDDERKIFG